MRSCSVSSNSDLKKTELGNNGKFSNNILIFQPLDVYIIFVRCSYIAGKTYYFGVGGSMRQFEHLVQKDGTFDTKIVWNSDEGILFMDIAILIAKIHFIHFLGLQREILKLTRK